VSDAGARLLNARSGMKTLEFDQCAQPVSKQSPSLADSIVKELEIRIEESRNNYERHSAFIIAREIVKALVKRNRPQ